MVLRVRHAVLSALFAGCMALDKDLRRQHLSPRAEGRESVTDALAHRVGRYFPSSL